MANDGNYIYAPINTSDVSTVIGVNSHDVATLCLSDKINPCSLIAPVWTQIPNLLPTDDAFKNLTSTAPSPSKSSWMYYAGCWGFHVPYTGSPANMLDVHDESWVRLKPNSNSFKCLAHFDGYRHDIKPALPFNVIANAGQEISVGVLISKTPSTDVVSMNGQNKGGIVSVANVLVPKFPNGLSFGCSIYRVIGINDVNKTLIGHYIQNYSTSLGFQVINTGFIAQSNQRYLIIPWVTDGTSVTNLQSGQKFFSLKFAPDIVSSVTVDIPVANVNFKSVSRSGNTINVTAENQFTSVQSLENIKLNFVYEQAGDLSTIQKDVDLSPIVSIPAKSGTTNGTKTASFSVANPEFTNAVSNNRLQRWWLTATYGANIDARSAEIFEKVPGGGGFTIPGT